MTAQHLKADYLIIGAGAMGMAFLDELLHRQPRKTALLVDRRARPGGHWNDAYPFVSLHQPAAYYGVNSERLGPGGAALVSGTEVLAYYERVLVKLLATGRVRYLPLCEYQAPQSTDARAVIRSLVSPKSTFEASVQKTVDSTYMDVRVPSTTPPKYAIDEACTVIAPNALARIAEPPPGYIIIGAGKTGIDAVLFLLGKGVAPASITWIVSNDAWLLNRAEVVPGKAIASFVGQLEEVGRSRDLKELLLASEVTDNVLRIDPDIWPTKFRCATVSGEELAQLRRIKNVVRRGRVRRVEPSSLVLDRGSITTDPDAVLVDCTADGLAKRPIRPVFAGARITLQSVFLCQQVFSAALISYVEHRFDDDRTKNKLCQPVPHPEFNRDYIEAMAVSNANFEAWGRAFIPWLRRSRLSLAHHESVLRLAVNTVRARRAMPAALVGMRRLHRQEFPDKPFPLDEPAAGT